MSNLFSEIPDTCFESFQTPQTKLPSEKKSEYMEKQSVMDWEKCPNDIEKRDDKNKNTQWEHEQSKQEQAIIPWKEWVKLWAKIRSILYVANQINNNKAITLEEINRVRKLAEFICDTSEEILLGYERDYEDEEEEYEEEDQEEDAYEDEEMDDEEMEDDDNEMDEDE